MLRCIWFAFWLSAYFWIFVIMLTMILCIWIEHLDFSYRLLREILKQETTEWKLRYLATCWGFFMLSYLIELDQNFNPSILFNTPNDNKNLAQKLSIHFCLECIYLASTLFFLASVWLSGPKSPGFYSALWCWDLSPV